MSETKTARQEALEFLAQETLDDQQLFDLTILTAKYVGYSVQQVAPVITVSGPIDVYRLVKDGVRVSAMDDAYPEHLWEEVPQYAESIDACWSLPLNGMLWILAHDGTPDGYNAELWHDLTANRIVYRTATSLPLAMLKAWWAIQDDNS